MKSNKPSDKDERLAEALRANLRRRKMPKKDTSSAETYQGGNVAETSSSTSG
jgi:hypothetical protein